MMDWVLGVDLGSTSASAFIDAGFDVDEAPMVYICNGYKESNLIVSDVAAEIQRRLDIHPYKAVVMDTGNLGKMIAEEIRKRHRIPVTYAEKQHKHAFIELFNSDLALGRIKVHESDPWWEEVRYLQWKHKTYGRPDEHGANHLCDAALYAYRECRHWLYEEKPEKIVYGSSEWYEQFEEEMYNAAIQTYCKTDSGNPWWDPYE